jgi:hypothetical protein
MEATKDQRFPQQQQLLQTFETGLVTDLKLSFDL